MNALKYFSLLIFTLSGFTLLSQPSEKLKTDSVYMIHTIDETLFWGTETSRTDSNISFQTQNLGIITIRKNKIKEMVLVSGNAFHKGRYWFPNPNSTRYFFSPSALNLKAGEGYYQNNYIFLNSIYVGVVDYVTIGGGVEIISLFSQNSPGPLYFLTLKGGVPIAKNLSAGAGVFFIGAPNDFSSSNQSEYAHFGISYGILTYGNKENNITLGGGLGFINSVWANRPIFTLSGMTRFSRKVSFITENWIVPSTKYVTEYDPANYQYKTYSENKHTLYVSYGLRFFGEKISIDLGFLNSGEIFKLIVIGIPYIDFVVKF